MNRPKWSEVLSDLPDLALSMSTGEFARHCTQLMNRRFGQGKWQSSYFRPGGPGRHYYDRHGIWGTVGLVCAEWWNWHLPEDAPALSRMWVDQLARDIHLDEHQWRLNTVRGNKRGQPGRRSTVADHQVILPCSCGDAGEWPVPVAPDGTLYREGQNVVWAVKYLHLLNDCPTMLPEEPVTPGRTTRAEVIIRDPLTYLALAKDVAKEKRGR